MIKNTRCAIVPFEEVSGEPLRPDTLSQILVLWVQLADALEERAKLGMDEMLIWSLRLSEGNNDLMQGPRAHATINLCKIGYLPGGAYSVSSPLSKVQETLVSLKETSLNIMHYGYITKYDGGVGLDEASRVIAHSLGILR